VKGDFWDCLDVKIHSSGRNAAELCWYLSVSDIFYQEVIRVHPRPIISFVFKPFANIKSVFICVHLCPKNSSEFVGATRRVARTEFGVKDDRVLFLVLGLFLSVSIRVHPCPIRSFVFKSFANMKSVFICVHPRPNKIFCCGSAALCPLWLNSFQFLNPIRPYFPRIRKGWIK